MKRATKVSIAIVLLLAAGFLWLLWPLPKPPDKEQIQAILKAGKRAVEKKDVQGCLKYVSREYSDDLGFRFDQLRFSLAQAFRNDISYDVVFNDIQIQVQGDTATADLNLTIVAHGPSRPSETHSGSLTLTFAREKARRYLILPDYAWRVTKASGLQGWTDLPP